MIKAFVTLGLSRLEAEMYVYIANKGPQKALKIANALNCNKSTVYDNLNKLQEKGLVTKELTFFSALPFAETLELLIARERKRMNHFQEATICPIVIVTEASANDIRCTEAIYCIYIRIVIAALDCLSAV